PPARTRERNDRTGCAVQPRHAEKRTTVRAAGRERRKRATRSHAEPRQPRRRLLGAVRAHDEGGAVTMVAAARAQARNRATVSPARARRRRRQPLWPRRPSL